MSVEYSASLMNIISYLRSNVYNKDAFINRFTDKLLSLKEISVTNVIYYPEQYGGLSVNIAVNPVRGLHTSEAYITPITSALFSAINDITDEYPAELSSMLSNICTIIITGENTLAVKI